MTRFEVLSPPPRRLPSLAGALGSVAFSIPLDDGLICGRPFNPFRRAISSRCSPTVRLSSATSPNSPTTRAFSSPFERLSMSPGSPIPRMNQNKSDLGIPKPTFARPFAPIAFGTPKCLLDHGLSRLSHCPAGVGGWHPERHHEGRTTPDWLSPGGANRIRLIPNENQSAAERQHGPRA